MVTINASLQMMETVFLLLHIQGAVHDSFPALSGFGICRKFVRTKTLRHRQNLVNIIGLHYLLRFGISYARINGSGVNFVLLFMLS